MNSPTHQGPPSTKKDSQTKHRTHIYFGDLEASNRQPRPSSPHSDSHPTMSVSELSKKRPRSPEDYEIPTVGAEAADLQESGISTPGSFKSRNESPWMSYKRVLDLDLNGPVTVAERQAPLSGLVTVKAFPLAAAKKALDMHRRVQHGNVVPVLETFMTEKSFYVVLEHLPISLEQIVQSAKYPTELQLAAILGPILDGLVYLEGEGLEHGSLNCSNVLLSTKGDVKIANQQCCNIPQGAGEPQDVRALGIIMMELMQKYTKDDGAIGVDDLRRWPFDCDAVAFLSETTSATTARDLRKHALLRRRSRKEDLIGLIFAAEVSARRYYSCKVL